MSGLIRSAGYLASPVTLPRASGRGTEAPIRLAISLARFRREEVDQDFPHAAHLVAGQVRRNVLREPGWSQDARAALRRLLALPDDYDRAPIGRFASEIAPD